MNKIINWLGQTMEFEGNLSAAIAEHRITNFPGCYIYDDGFINIATDPEIPIKGYMVLAINKPISSITSLNKFDRVKLIELCNRLLEAMHKVGYKDVMIFQDEGSSGYFHINFIPRHEWTYKFHSNIGEMGLYAKSQLNTSDEYRKELLNCIENIKHVF